MNFDYYFPLFEDILHGKLNPMLPANTDSHTYSVRLQEQIIVSVRDTGIYGLHYLKPLTLKARFYQQKIVSETLLYIADMQDYLAGETNLQIRTYLRDQMLDKHLSTCLIRLGEKIRTEKLLLSGLTEAGNDTDNNRLADIYVFHLLKVCVAKAYLEIQELLADVVAYRQTEEWLYSSLVGEIRPIRHFLQKQSKPQPTENKTAHIPQTASAPPQQSPVEHYNTSEVYNVLRISESTLLRYKKREDFPKPVRQGNKDLYPKAEIDAWKVRNK
jgi:predicted DNA-binding transcriptional regulator AlpA